MTAATLVLRNAARRPVELHLADRVEILFPESAIELAAAEMTGAGIAPLLAEGILTCHDAPEPKPKRKTGPEKKAKAKTRTKSKTKTPADGARAAPAARAAASKPGADARPAPKGRRPASPSAPGTIAKHSGEHK